METSVAVSTSPPIQTQHHLHTSSTEPAGNELDGDQAISVVAPTGPDTASTWNPSTFLPLAFGTEPSPGTTTALVIQDTSPPADAAVPATNTGEQPLPAIIDPAAPGWEASETRGEWAGEREEESQDDDSTDEEDYPFWVNLKEDTSSPDEEELRAIEQTTHEVSALDCG